MINISLEDIKQYIADKPEKKETKLVVRLNEDYQFKLKQLKEKLNLESDSIFVRGLIDLLYDNYIKEGK